MRCTGLLYIGTGCRQSNGMAAVNLLRDKQGLVCRLLAAKEATGKTFTQIAAEIGTTNAYTAQLFYNQANTFLVTIINGCQD